MENQSTNNNIDKLVENKVVCRKCGGSHFTIKCGKEKQPEQSTKVDKSKLEENKKSDDKTQDKINKQADTNIKKSWYGDRNDRDRKPRYEDSNRTFEKRPYFKTTYRVKLSDLPIDMSEEEMMELTCDWGHIVRIRVLNYYESSVAYIDFGYEEEADYFVKAIDKTPFGFLVILAQRVESQRQETKNE
jgi:hypothetical protein